MERVMTAMHDSSDQAARVPSVDGFDVLDACHQQTLLTLDKLTALVARLGSSGTDDEARATAAEIVHFFSTTARQHHEDEERHVFPKMVTNADPEIVQAVLRLSQDHNWLEEDWMEISPQVDAVACGLTWYDLDVLREGVEIFAALSRDHIALEESLIYPQARARLRVGERREMGREMAARRRAQRNARSASPAPIKRA
jgi:hemerythrin-like domain-containing protein